MKKNLVILPLLIFPFFFNQCLCSSSKTSDDPGITSVSYDVFNSISGIFADINAAGIGTVAYNTVPPLKTPTLRQRVHALSYALSHFSLGSQLNAADTSAACPGGGNYALSISSGVWGSTTYVTSTRTFTNCTGAYGHGRIDNAAQLKWSNLQTTGSPWLQTNSMLLRAPATQIIRTMIGTGETIYETGNGSSSTYPVSHTVIWTDYESIGAHPLSIAINTTFRHYSSSAASSLLRTVVLTSRPYVTSTFVTGQTARTVSGTLVADVTESDNTNYSVVITLTNVVWDANYFPTSGTATMSVSGGKSGTGTYTFGANGEVNYTYTEKKTYESVIDVDGV